MRSLLPQALRGWAPPVWRSTRPDADLQAASPGQRTLRVYFIKASKYDDDGTVLLFRWGVIPNNTLTVLAALNDAYAAERPHVALQTVVWDELVDGALSAETIASIRDRAAADGVELLIGLAGVQTNQYPRARDIALQFRRLDVAVLMGGFHVSSHEPTCDFLATVGIGVVRGEAETTWACVLDEFLAGRPALRYDVAGGMRVKTGLDDITVPVLRAAALPAVSARYLRRFFNPTLTTLDTSRGCPFTCSYCAVKNVMGRTMRPRDPYQVVDWIRDAHDRHGVRSLFFVDDDFYRSPAWETVLEGLAELRRSGRDLWFMMQADVESAADTAGGDAPVNASRRQRSRRFVDLAAAAGCYAVFMGFESLNAANLEQVAKRHNEDPRDRRRRSAASRDMAAVSARVVARYRQAVETWHGAGIAVHAGYMIGLPHDDAGCGAHAARTLAEIGVDLASFFVHTLLPGTEEYAQAVAAGTCTDTDFDHYDTQHFVGTHPRLSAAAIVREYRAAYRTFYTWRRLAWSAATLHRVPSLSRASRLGMVSQHVYYTYAERCGRHPMLGGIWRRHDRSVRREVVDDQAAAAHYLIGGDPDVRQLRADRVAAPAWALPRRWAGGS